MPINVNSETIYKIDGHKVSGEVKASKNRTSFTIDFTIIGARLGNQITLKGLEILIDELKDLKSFVESIETANQLTKGE